jgi:alpha-1,3-rhamnosyltransferase
MANYGRRRLCPFGVNTTVARQMSMSDGQPRQFGAAAVSVVIPSFNHAAYVEACLRSVFNQSLPPDQLLVIDDGSEDDSVRIIEKLLNTCPFPAELISRPRKGLSATLNEGLRRTSGEFFAYIGSDDIWHPDRLKLGVEALRANPDAVLSYGECLFIDDQGRVISYSRRRWPHSPDVSLEDLFRFRSLPLTPTITYRRAAAEQVGWNESSFLEDYESDLMLRSLGPFVFVPHVLGSWRQHAAQVSKQLQPAMEEALATQRRVASRLGIPDRELARYQASVRFFYGEQFLRTGQWRRGVALTMQNFSAAPSPSALVDRALRIAIPSRLIRARRDLLTRRSARRQAPDGAREAQPTLQDR